MIGGQDENSCGKSGTGETPQERMRREGSAADCGKRSLARNQLTCHERSAHVFYLFVVRLN
ncbi:hypothetical protein P8831_15425 [Priestia megaterium]|uniref:hypothetical protein n=1 Tax=Priestia megaterium TaxID=1404 RepID=UPI002D7E1D98|nr:hypothetical protein [Priestia megaterium]MEB4870115.1 hypothetical protein [Priestia megaterium]